MNTESQVKGRLLAACDELKAVVLDAAVDYGDRVVADIEDLEESIRSYVFKVFLVGEFSCGKSSLLNRWLGRDLLFTGLTPKTAVSSELHYDAVEHMVLQFLDQSEPDEDLPGISEANMERVHELANAGKLANVVLHVNNPVLKEYSDLCLVDLPGLSSANAAHEAALNKFLGERQCVAVFCIPISDGSIQESSLAFLRKMGAFGSLRRFEFLLTKADEKIASDQELIMNKVREDLSSYGMDDAFIGKVSRESVSDFTAILDSFRRKKERFMLKWFGDRIRTVGNGLIDSLRIALSAQFDSSRIDDALERIQDAERDLPALLDDIDDEMRRSAEVAVDDIVATIRDNVQSQKGALWSCAQNGGDVSSELLSLMRSTIASKGPTAVRSVMADAGKRVGNALDDQLDFDFDDEQPDAPNLTVSVSGEGAENQGGESVGHEFSMQILGEDPIAPLRKSKNTFFENFTFGWDTAMVIGTLLPGIGTFATVALTTLVGYFKLNFGGSQDVGRQEAEFEMKLSSACEQARPTIASSIETAVAQCGSKLRTAVNDRMKALHQQMRQLKAEAAAGRSEWEATQDKRREAKSRIESVLREIEV